MRAPKACANGRNLSVMPTGCPLCRSAKPTWVGSPLASSTVSFFMAASQVSNALGTVVPVDKIVELGHRYGARVLIDAAQSIQHMPVDVSELGADFLINYRTDEFDKKIRELTNKRGVDVVVDYIGADTWVRSLRSARRGGRVLTCGATTGFAPQTDLRQIFFRQVHILGSTMGSHRDFLDVMHCVFRGQLRPVIDRVLPLSEARKGHELIEQRAVFGKIVLRVETGQN